MMMNLLYNILSKSSFPKVKSVQNELQKIGLLRWGVGIIIFIRFYEVVNSLYFFNQGLPVVAYATMLLIVLFTLGFALPVVTIGLIIAVRMLDAYASTNTLGTTILIHLFLLMFLSNAGQYYSIDAFIVKKKNKFAKLFNLQYSIIGKHTEKSLTLVYFFIFSLYAIISLAALGYHIQDVYWIEALTIKSLLSNSYLSTGYEGFRWVENTYPNLVSYLSFIGIVGQSLFQFFMLFLVFIKWGNFFVKWWGMKFFVISLFVINLSYLPHLEIILWLIIFFPIRISSENKVKIIYDDYCNLCKKAMLFFKKYNFNNRYEFIALSKNRELYEKHNLTEKEVKTYMVGWYKGKLYKGYNLYFRLMLVNPLFYILVPIFIIGYLTGLGKLIYNYIAERRYKVFGQCEISFYDEIQRNDIAHFSNFKPKFLSRFLLVYMFFLISFFLLRFPYVGDKVSPRIPGIVQSYLKKTIYKVGLEVPVVFNDVDLSMGDNWMVLYKKNEQGEWDLIPISGEDGHRMSYNGSDIMHFTNHNSDFLYFGTTLRYRRTILKVEDYKAFHEEGFGRESFEKRVKYDYVKTAMKGNVSYKIMVYSNTSSKVSHWEATPERHERELKYEAVYSYNGKEFHKQK